MIQKSFFLFSCEDNKKPKNYLQVANSKCKKISKERKAFFYVYTDSDTSLIAFLPPVGCHCKDPGAVRT